MTHESPGKVLGLLAVAVVSLFFMVTVTTSNVAWGSDSGAAILDPFSPANVMEVIDHTAYVYSSAVHTFLIDPFRADYSFIPENLVWIKDNAQLALAVAVGLEDPLPQTSGPGLGRGQVAGASVYSDLYSEPYYDNVFTLLMDY